MVPRVITSSKAKGYRFVSANFEIVRVPVNINVMKSDGPTENEQFNCDSVDRTVYTGGFREGAKGPGPLPLFAQNLPSNISKNQDLIFHVTSFSIG
jgi:hypothetical protein